MPAMSTLLFNKDDLFKRCLEYLSCLKVNRIQQRQVYQKLHKSLIGWGTLQFSNRRARFKKCNKNCLNTNIYSYLETSGGQSSNLHLNDVHFLNISVN